MNSMVAALQGSAAICSRYAYPERDRSGCEDDPLLEVDLIVCYGGFFPAVGSHPRVPNPPLRTDGPGSRR